MVSQERLKELLRYNPCTGQFYWRKGRRQGFLAGSTWPDRRRIRIDRKGYLASRLAWLYVYGEIPDEIDHIDRRSLNDSIWNLANGTHSDNMRNTDRREMLINPLDMAVGMVPSTVSRPKRRKN